MKRSVPRRSERRLVVEVEILTMCLLSEGGADYGRGWKPAGTTSLEERRWCRPGLSGRGS